jgi:hypothetical protein
MEKILVVFRLTTREETNLGVTTIGLITMTSIIFINIVQKELKTMNIHPLK